MDKFLDFENQTVVVTGGARGIGYAIVHEFLRYGARVVIADLDASGEQKAEELRKAGRKVSFIPCDVSRFSDLSGAAEAVERDFGGCDVLVNNAGVFPRADLQQTDDALWDKVIGINLKGTLNACKAFAPSMAKHGGGSIVNIGSTHARRGAPNTLVYAISKAGVVTLTRNLAHSLANDRIRVNCIHPGWVASEGEVALWESQGNTYESMRRHFEKMPLGRLQTGEDIAKSVVFIASSAAGQVTGQEFAVDGGITVR